MTCLSIAAFDARGRVVPVRDGGPLRCASLLKPIYGWAVDAPGWDRIATAMITRSDNAATDRLEGVAGGTDALANRVTARTGVVLAADTWGRFEVTAAEVAAMYAAMLAAAPVDPQAAAALRLMREVAPTQQLGARDRWAEATAQDPGAVGVKAGWDLSPDEPWLRTHVAVAGQAGGAVVMSAVPCTSATRALWESRLAAGGPEAVIDLHLSHTGPALHDGLRLAAGALDAAGRRVQ